MLRICIAMGALFVLTMTPSAIVEAQEDQEDARALVNAAVRAMGAENLRTLEFSASGSNARLGQNVNPNRAWPTVPVKSYTRQLDLDAAASSAQLIRMQNGVETISSEVIEPNAPWERQFDFWVTPYGFLKGAMANTVALRSDTITGVTYNVVRFVIQDKYTVEGYINDQNLVERVRTWVDNDVLGDMLVEGIYFRYQDFDGLKAPTFMTVNQGGYPTRILEVSDVRANVPVTISGPQPAAAPVGVIVEGEEVTDGVYYLKGGSHHSVLVEFNDHVAVIEGPQNEARSLAVMAEVNRLVPNKPIRYLINTHHHFDHSGGLRAYVDAGTTIVTDDINQAFYEEAFRAPRTLNPDRLEESKRTASIEVTGEMRVMGDATRTLELHLIQDNPHNDGMLIAFLSAEKIVVEVDMYTPPAPNAPAPARDTPVNPNAVALLDNLERLRLDFETILPLHGGTPATRADLYAFVERPLVPISALPVPESEETEADAPVSAADASLLELVETACSACHSVERVNSTRADRDTWAATVARMVDNGAAISDEEATLIIDFLARTLSP